MRATPSNAGIAAICLFFAGCGSSESKPPVPIDDLARAIADALCNNIGPCCQQAGFAHDPVQCRANAENEFRTEVELNRGSSNIVYDGNAARECVDTYAAVVKACYPEREIGSACDAMFAGTLQPGQTCARSAECIPGASCERSGGGVALQCTSSSLVRGKLGQTCGTTCTENGGITGCSGSGGSGGEGDGGAVNLAQCFTNDGLYCDRAHGCAAAPALGQACTSDTPCAGDAFCDNGACVAKRTTGPCEQFGDSCAATAYCETSTRECQPRKSTGAACTTGAECSTRDRCTDGTCRTPTIATESSCMGNL
jgi:hypothetical protein